MYQVSFEVMLLSNICHDITFEVLFYVHLITAEQISHICL
jgi:hypothetical protein